MIDFPKSTLFILLQRSHRQRPEAERKAAGQPGLTTCHHRKRSAKRNGPDEGRSKSGRKPSARIWRAIGKSESLQIKDRWKSDLEAPLPVAPDLKQNPSAEVAEPDADGICKQNKR